MHIDFRLGLQKLGSLSTRKFFPEQIDEVLNIVVDQFIQDSIKYEDDGEHFHRVQVDVDRIKTLLIRDYVMDVNQQTSYANAIRKASTPLPPDYAYLISDSIGMGKLCSTSVAATVNDFVSVIAVEDAVLVTEEIDEDDNILKYYQVFKLVSTAGGPNTVVDLGTDIDAQLADDLYTGFSSLLDKPYAMRLLWEVAQENMRAGLWHTSLKGLYWERYGKIYRPNRFILVTTITTSGDLTINAVTFNYAPFTEARSRYSDDVSAYFPSRLTRASAIDNVLTTPFLKPFKNSPVSLIADNEFIIYTPESVIVTKAVFTYIRKPSRINVALQRNCELPEEFHPLIVEKAIEYAAGKIEQVPLYQVQKDITKP